MDFYTKAVKLPFNFTIVSYLLVTKHEGVLFGRFRDVSSSEYRLIFLEYDAKKNYWFGKMDSNHSTVMISHLRQTSAGVDILKFDLYSTAGIVYSHTLEDPTNYLFPSSKAYYL